MIQLLPVKVLGTAVTSETMVECCWCELNLWDLDIFLKPFRNAQSIILDEPAYFLAHPIFGISEKKTLANSEFWTTLSDFELVLPDLELVLPDLAILN